jgi:hypothetical protein
MVPPDPSVCARAPFTPNILAGGALATYRTRASDGVVVQKDTRRVGRATACGLLTEIAPFVQGPLYIELTIDDDLLIALGKCTLASVNTPAPGILTFACALNLTNPHGQIKGGFLVSSSALDLLDLGLVDTGSYWTLRLYEDD